MAIEAHLQERLDEIREELAVILTISRQRQLLGDEDALLPVDEIETRACSFIQEEIIHLFPDAEHNCALLNVLAGFSSDLDFLMVSGLSNGMEFHEISRNSIADFQLNQRKTRHIQRKLPYNGGLKKFSAT